MYITTDQKREFLNLDKQLSEKTLNIVAKNTTDNSNLIISNIIELKKVNIVLLVCDLLFMIFFTYIYFLLEKTKYIYLSIFTIVLFFIGICMVSYSLAGFSVYYSKLNNLIRKNFVNKSDMDILIDVIYNDELINRKNYSTYISIKKLTCISWLIFLIILLIDVSCSILY